ncbi:prenyltransferase [Frisingicoccus sp.]|uniref:prenyltransferase n=1 Tax=Frisingicoccus sp. TaxID=1918627 RepID=UPI00399541FF
MRQSEHYRPLTPRLALNLAAPHTWAASVFPALFADFYCWQQGLGLTWFKGIMLLAACIFLQSAVNTLNDYFDFIKGADSADDHVEVSDAVLIYGNVAPGSALILGIVYMAAGAVLGLASCIGSGMVPIIIGIIGGVVILIYSGGPIPVSYLPIGEIVSGFVMGGLIPLGIAGCADGEIHWQILLYSLPMIAGIALIMMSNNGSDIEKDRKAGRRTLPTCIGRVRTLELYRYLIVSWLTLAVVLPVTLLGPIGFVSGILTVFLGGKIIRKQLACTLEPEERIAAMKGIAMTNIVLNGAYTAAFAAGFILEVLHG